MWYKKHVSSLLAEDLRGTRADISGYRAGNRAILNMPIGHACGGRGEHEYRTEERGKGYKARLHIRTRSSRGVAMVTQEGEIQWN